MFANIFNLLLCCLLTSRVLCLFDLCNHKIEMKPGEKLYVNSPYYPAEYPTGSSCRYVLQAPQDYKLQFDCNIKLNTPPSATNCQNEIFYFNSEGSEVLTGSEYFCGTGKMERKSFLNQAVLSYISTANYKRVQTKANPMTDDDDDEEENQTDKKEKAEKQQKIKKTTTPTTSKLLKELQLTTLTATITKPAAATTTEPVTTSFTTPLPTSSKIKVNRKIVKNASEKDKKVNNSFAYVVALLSNKSGQEALTTTAQLLKSNTTIIATTPIKPPSSSIPISVLKLNELLPVSRWHNNSIVTHKISTKRVAKVIVGQDYTTSTTMTATWTNSSSSTLQHNNLPSGKGGGSFSCLVEVIQPLCECGWGSTVKIAGASGAAGIGEFPSMAGIMTIKNRQIFCGATIIHHRYLLSAAHCYLATETNTPEYLTAVVGEHDLSTVMDSFYTRQYDLIKIILHEQFRTSSFQSHNDIALLKTRFAIDWNRGVGPACLPFTQLTYNREVISHAGQRVETAGWGTTSFGGQQSSVLLKTTLDVIAHSTCQRLVGNLGQAVFCTHTPGRDTCQYDSGGPLYARRERLFAVGIVSYGYACATNRPSVNTRISAYLKWIINKTPEAKYCVR